MSNETSDRPVSEVATARSPGHFTQRSHPGPHNVIVAGNNAAAKAQVTSLLEGAN